MAIIHRKSASLPHGRTDLYERISAAYLESIDMTRELDQLPYSLPQKRRWLSEIGFQMQLRRSKSKSNAGGDDSQILATEAEVCSWLVKSMREAGAEHPEDEAAEILDYIARRSGLLVPRGEGLFAFMHLSLQEYFAACHLEPRLTESRFSRAPRMSPTDRQLQLWASRPEWLEVFVLVFELLADKDVTHTESLFSFLFGKKFKAESGGRSDTSVRLLAEIVTDPFVLLTADSRRTGRSLCWKAEFDRKLEERPYGHVTPTQLLVAEQKGDLAAAWNAAGMSATEVGSRCEELVLDNCAGLSDLRPIGAMAKLRELSLTLCTKVTDISPLAKLRGLERLSLGGCTGISDLGPIRGLRKLETLSMWGTSVGRDLEVVSRLASLKQLVLEDGESFDWLMPLSRLKALERLSIEQLDVPVNLTPLLKCRNLTSLTIESSESPQDLSSLASHPSLLELHLHNFPSTVDLLPFCGKSVLRLICLGGTIPDEIPNELLDRGIIAGRSTMTRK